MSENLYFLCLSIPFAPLVGAVLAGLFGRWIGKIGAHSVTILGVAISFVCSCWVFKYIVIDQVGSYETTLYHWMISDGIRFQIGFLVDKLTVVMTTVVTFVSLMVHIYTIGYMKDDPGYQRFFSYIALFTFAMLMLVMANNFMQLFFGWEAVGLMSYLLIGFWYTRESAVFANLKAFIVNRVGDFGFLLGIAAVLHFSGSLDYSTVFAKASSLEFQKQTISLWPGVEWSAVTVICILLFIGAMGKSAQVPLHVWLPDSMEGPTPISALIHAATMVTAGIFMVARMSPLFELSTTALSVVLVIGAITALFMGILGIVQNDIKRVVAYSTLSQLGYMTVALGVSAYSASIFHLMTHAFFKALLFLGAGSVIVALHHEQDIRRMGNLYKYMPITYFTMLIGTLALIGFPGFSGYYSKDAIIEAVKHSEIAGAQFAYYAVLGGVFITALYSFRMFFLVFHGKERMDHHTQAHLKESPWMITLPLILLAIPSAFIGAYVLDPMILKDFFGAPAPNLSPAIYVEASRDVLSKIRDYDLWGFTLHGLTAWPVYLTLAGALTAWFFTLKRPDLAHVLATRMRALHTLLLNKYYFDHFNQLVFAAGSRLLGRVFWKAGDVKLIDGILVNGSARAIGWFSRILRRLQSGYLYHYAAALIFGLVVMLTWLIYKTRISA